MVHIWYMCVHMYHMCYTCVTPKRPMATFPLCGSYYNFTNYISAKRTLDFHHSGKVLFNNSRFFSEIIVGGLATKSPNEFQHKNP